MATANIYDLADTWNDGTTTFTAIKMDVTDTASASGSLLMDLQIGSSSKFSVDSSGGLSLDGIIAPIDYSNVNVEFGNGVFLVRRTDTGTIHFSASATSRIVQLAANGTLGWSNTADSSISSPDLFLTRKGTANLRLGAADAAGPVAQTLSVQSVVAGTSNTAGQDFTIQGSAGTGSGAGGSIIFQVAPAGGSGTGQNTLVDALTINSSKSLILNNYNSNPYAGLAFPISGTYSVGLYQPADYTFRISMSNASAGGQISSAYQGFNFQIDSAILSWGLTSLDIVLARDAADTLALRRGANAQTFNIYNTYTDATDFERGFMKWDTNVFTIGTDAGGSGGTDRALALLVGGSQALSANTAGNISFGFSVTSTGSSLGSTAIGRQTVASGAASVAIGHGVSANTGPEATGAYSISISNGYGSRKSTASGIVSSVLGGASALADKVGQNAYGLYGFGAQGDAQVSTLGFVGSTTDATPTEIFLLGLSNQRAVVPANKTWAFVLTLVARSSGGTDNAMYVRRGVIKRDGANNTSLVGSVDTVYTNETDASWDIAITADDTNESLKVEVTGAAATNIRWVAKVELAEVAYA